MGRGYSTKAVLLGIQDMGNLSVTVEARTTRQTQPTRGVGGTHNNWALPLALLLMSVVFVALYFP